MRLTDTLHAALKSGLPLGEEPVCQEWDRLYSSLSREFFGRADQETVVASYLLSRILSALDVEAATGIVVSEDGSRTSTPVPETWLADALTSGDPVVFLARGEPKARIIKAGDVHRYSFRGWPVRVEGHVGSWERHIPVQLTDGSELSADLRLVARFAREGSLESMLWPKDCTLGLVLIPGVLTAWCINLKGSVAAWSDGEAKTHVVKGTHGKTVGRMKSRGYDLPSLGRLLALAETEHLPVDGLVLHGSPSDTGWSGALDLVYGIGRETRRNIDLLGGKGPRFVSIEEPVGEDLTLGDTLEAPKPATDSPQVLGWADKDKALHAIEQLPLTARQREVAEAVIRNESLEGAAKELGVELDSLQRTFKRLMDRLAKEAADDV